MRVQTGFTDLVRGAWRGTPSVPLLPIFGAPMASVSGGSLAAATARSGSLGSIAMPLLRGAAQEGNERDPCGSLAKLDEEVRTFRREAPAGAPLCLGFLPDHCLKRRSGSYSLIVDAIEEQKPEFVQVFAPASNKIIRLIRDCPNAPLVLAQVGSVQEAKRVVNEAKVDVVIAQGNSAGGHGFRYSMGMGTICLAQSVVEIASQADHDCLVLAAGGIVDGRGAAAALVLGCAGAVVGTRLAATSESLWDDQKKQTLVEASGDEFIKCVSYDVLNNKIQSSAETLNNIEWRFPYDACGVVWQDKGSASEEEFWSERNLGSMSLGDTKKYLSDHITLSGEGVGSIKSVRDAEDVLLEIGDDLGLAIKRAQDLLIE